MSPEIALPHTSLSLGVALNFPPPKMEIIAHRGASAYYLENSRQAIIGARNLGADRAEIDIRITADEVPVVLHDPELGRTTDGEGPLSRHRFRELKEIHLRNGEPILTLEEALSLSHALSLPLYLDIKDGEEALEPVIWVLGRFRCAGEIVASGNPALLESFHRRNRHIPTSLLVSSTDPEAVEVARGIGAHFIHPCWEREKNPVGLLRRGFLEVSSRAGLGIVLWHEERPRQLRHIGRLGERIYGVTTNAPDLAERILKGHHGTPAKAP